jgi:hypothetical protein
MLDKTMKQAHSVDVAIPNSHNLHGNNTQKLQKAHIVPPVLFTTVLSPTVHTKV